MSNLKNTAVERRTGQTGPAGSAAAGSQMEARMNGTRQDAWAVVPLACARCGVTWVSVLQSDPELAPETLLFLGRDSDGRVLCLDCGAWVCGGVATARKARPSWEGK